MIHFAFQSTIIVLSGLSSSCTDDIVNQYYAHAVLEIRELLRRFAVTSTPRSDLDDALKQLPGLFHGAKEALNLKRQKSLDAVGKEEQALQKLSDTFDLFLNGLEEGYFREQNILDWDMLLDWQKDIRKRLLGKGTNISENSHWTPSRINSRSTEQDEPLIPPKSSQQLNMAYEKQAPRTRLTSSHDPFFGHERVERGGAPVGRSGALFRREGTRAGIFVGLGCEGKGDEVLSSRGRPVEKFRPRLDLTGHRYATGKGIDIVR